MSESKIQWVSSAEKLPDDEITVLIATSDCDVSVGHMDGEEWRYENDRLIKGLFVTHWAHLPEPPSTHRTKQTESR